MIKRTAGQVLHWTLLLALTAYGQRRNGWDAVQVWMWWLAVVGASLWLRYRLETRLSRPVYTSLVEAVRAQPADTPLVDYETGDRLAITGKRYLGLPDGWWVLRIPQEPSGEDAMSDFNLGRTVSTIPYTGFLVRAGCISTRVNAVAVTAPQELGQPPIPLDPPRPSPWRRRQALISRSVPAPGRCRGARSPTSSSSYAGRCRSTTTATTAQSRRSHDTSPLAAGGLASLEGAPVLRPGAEGGLCLSAPGLCSWIRALGRPPAYRPWMSTPC